MFQISFGRPNYSQFSDEELLQKTKQGEQAAFEIIYDRWNKKLYNYLLTILNYNTEDASQILSEVFIKMYEYNKKTDIEKFKGLLYQMARNKAIDWIKTNRSESQKDFDTETLENMNDNSEINMKKEVDLQYKRDLMEKFINMLDFQQKEALYLHIFEEKSYDEIAEIMESNKNSIGTLIFKAKKNLKGNIERAGMQKILSELV